MSNSKILENIQVVGDIFSESVSAFTGNKIVLENCFAWKITEMKYLNSDHEYFLKILPHFKVWVSINYYLCQEQFSGIPTIFDNYPTLSNYLSSKIGGKIPVTILNRIASDLSSTVRLYKSTGSISKEDYDLFCEGLSIKNEKLEPVVIDSRNIRISCGGYKTFLTMLCKNLYGNYKQTYSNIMDKIGILPEDKLIDFSLTNSSKSYYINVFLDNKKILCETLFSYKTLLDRTDYPYIIPDNYMVNSAGLFFPEYLFILNEHERYLNKMRRSNYRELND